MTASVTIQLNYTKCGLSTTSKIETEVPDTWLDAANRLISGHHLKNCTTVEATVNREIYVTHATVDRDANIRTFKEMLAATATGSAIISEAHLV